MLAVATAGCAQAVISCDKTNILYSGIDNPVSVAVAGEKASNITVSISDGKGSLTKAKEAGRYIVRPTGESKFITLDVNKKGKKVATQIFKVKPIPTPELRLAGYRNGDKVSRKTLTEGARFIAVRPEGFGFELAPDAMRITNVDVYISNKVFEGKDKLTPEMVSAIRRAERGDLINIDATVQMPDSIPCHIYSSLTIADHKEYIIVPLFDKNGNLMVDEKGRQLFVEEPYEESEWEDDED